MSRPYPEYRDIGDVWLGALPSHWEVRRLKQVAHAYPSNVDKKSHEGELPVRLCNYTDVYYNDVIADADGLMAATASAEQIEKFSLRAGDVIITKDSETADDIAVSTYVPDDLPGVVCGYHLSMIRPKAGTSGAFLKRYFDSHYAKSSVAVRANGLTRVGLGQYAVDNLLVPIPPLQEQTAIACFLDRETGKIDALVETQRRLIELLKEKRQAVISHAVTRGVDPTAPLKDTGVEWLGEVPEHWRIVPIGALFQFVKRQDGSDLEVLSVYRDHGVIEKSSRNDNHNVTPADLSNYQTVLKGDLVINKMKAWQGSLGISGLNGITSPDYAVFKPTHSECDDYLHLLLRSRPLPDVYRLISNGIRLSQWRLEPDKFKTLKVPIPPATEQREIAARVAAAIGAMDALAEEAEKVIATLQERRGVLISAAVTGGIDVRDQVKKTTTMNRRTARRLVGAAILELVADTPASGRMTSAKRMYLAEAHAGVWELQGQPQRMAAGPFDGALMSEVEAELARVGHIETSQPSGPNSQVHYRLAGQRGALRAELEALLGDRRTAFDKMLADLGELESRGVEAVATLYAVWNDLLIDGKTPTDDAVIGGVLHDWHTEKRDKFTKVDLHNYLGWMRRHAMTPTGRGPRTKAGALL